MSSMSFVVVGGESLLVQCSRLILQRGHTIEAVVTGNGAVAEWATSERLRVVHPSSDLGERLGPIEVDWLLSIANLTVLPAPVLALARMGAVNFHDGPLPRYAGLNAPVWALLNRETRHSVTWHLIEGGVDEGDILEERSFAIDPDETALSLNTKCFAAALESFTPLLACLEAGAPARQQQDLGQRRYYARAARPPAAARLDFRRSAEEIAALVRALDHGDYWNPMALAKIETGVGVLLVGRAEVEPDVLGGAPGTVLALREDGLVVATGSVAITLGRLSTVWGEPVAAERVATVGAQLPSPNPGEAEQLTQAIAAHAAREGFWRRRLADLKPADLPQARTSGEGARFVRRDLSLPGEVDGRLLVAIAAWAARSSGRAVVDIAYRDAAFGAAAGRAPGYLADWVPVRFGSSGDASLGEAALAFARDLEDVRRNGTYALDLVARDPALTRPATPQVGVVVGASEQIEGTVVSVALPSGAATPFMLYDSSRIASDEAERLGDRLETLVAAARRPASDALPVHRLPLLSESERDLLIEGWNATEMPVELGTCVHEMIEAQADRTPDAVAIVFETERVSYRELDSRANRLAHVLRGLAVGPGVLVGLHLPRSLELVTAALAIHKAGGAYVPLDPTYPSSRIAHYLADSAAPVVITRSDVLDRLPPHAAEVLLLDRDPRVAQAAPTRPDRSAASADLAYVIYTSGSTGRPKGVMVEHRNVANFFAGMDERIGTERGTWLAVTSLAFDISVLELFWTLSRGFTVVLSSDENRRLVSSGRRPASARRMEFSLFYWGNDDGVGSKKYELLIEGAKFADANGFAAVWTPERHFHAFGGPYPNPAVTGAAVAAVTKNLGVRAGSCVAPLHHPARIAEDWAVIDNLTNGRAGLAIASGWQPDDFVLRPENTPPKNKAAMIEAIDTVRKLWRGEAVAFPTKSGAPLDIVTQPRPVSPEVPIWITTAGNPETWREAGTIGAHVLTHLLGQSIEEVRDKIVLYREALRAAGHDASRFKVTLMLHTLVGADREQIRERAREPMKLYLQSAAALIKQYAWAFPAFKKPTGAASPMDIDLRSLDREEMDAILDFAFRRYFEESGLFGTVEDCVARVEQLKLIGVDEIACLIDYGVPVEEVLNGLAPLAEVLRRSNRPGGVPEDDFSIAGLIERHAVTHLQCTPSMARMLSMNDEAQSALRHLKHLLIGGEALSGALVASLQAATGARIENMYGPTETTIWSSTGSATAEAAVVPIGRPIANTRLYVLDPQGEPVPIGMPGELWIGGYGVARGYWGQPELTAERFRADPFLTPEADAPQGRMYRTGDLVRRRADGALDFLGRLDHQVKIRGHRIELGEVEACLAALPGIQDAVALGREDAPGDVRLVAYLVADAPVDPGAVQAAVGNVLPQHMVPAHIVQVERLPLTPNGKVDRKALPAPRASVARASETRPAEVSGTAEATIAEIWSRLLGVTGIRSKDNFFQLGGHSLLAVQAHREIRAAFGAEALSITDIFRFPTLEALAAHLGKARGSATAPPPPNESDAAAGGAASRMELMTRRRALRGERLGGAH